MLTRLQEIALIARCVAADDRHAFGQLVEAYADDIRRLLLSLTRGGVPLVDDLAQETFIKAYLSIRSFHGIARFKTWLYRIAYNEYVSYSRKNRTTELHPIESLAEEEIADATEDVANTISDETLQECLARLTDVERAIVQLFYFDDFSIARISTVTGLPSGTVKSHLSRSRKKLAKFLKDYE